MSWWNPFKPSPPKPLPPTGDSSKVEGGYSGPSYGPTTPVVTPSTPQVGTAPTSSGSSGGGSSGGSSRSSGGSSGTTNTAQQMASVTAQGGVITSQPSTPVQASTSATQVQQTSGPQSLSDLQSSRDRTFLNRIGLARGDEPTTFKSGALILTPQEAMGMSGSRKPYVTTEGISFGNSVGFGSAIGQTYQYDGPSTRQSYKLNVQGLEASKQFSIAEADLIKQFKADPESFKGRAGFSQDETGYSISGETFKESIDYDSILKGAKETAKDRYSNLDRRTRVGLTSAEVGVGVGKVAVGLPLAGLNLAMAGTTTTFKEGDLKPTASSLFFGDGSKSLKWAEGTTFGNIQNAPTGLIGKTATYGTIVAGVATGATMNIRSLGFKEGIAETASYGGMYKIRSGTFTPTVTASDKTIIQSVRLTETGRVYTGTIKGTGITFQGIESKGVGVLQTNTPTIFIRGGGLWSGQGKITTGQLYRNLPSTNLNLGGLQGSAGQTIVYGQTNFVTEAGRFRSFSQDFTRINYQPSQATFVKPISSNVNLFTTSKAKPIYKYSKDSTGFTYAPSGRFQVYRPNVFGRELNLAGFGKEGGASSSGFRVTGGPKTPLSQTFQAQTPTFNIPSPAPITQPQATFAKPIIASGSQTQTQFPRITTQQSTFQAPRIQTQQTTMQSSTTAFPPIVTTSTATIGGSRNRVLQTPRIDITPKQDERQRTVIAQAFVSPRVTGGPRIPTTFSPSAPFPFLLPKFFGADSSGGLGKIKASRTYRYTPSFGALAKGETFKVGALSTKKFTGLEFRGMTEKKTKKKTKKSKK